MRERFAELERDGKIERVPVGRPEVERLHTIVARDLQTAASIREQNADWALTIVYNAVMQACRALMTAYGYRAKGEGQHRTIIEFVRLVMPDHNDLPARVDRLRRRRHQTFTMLPARFPGLRWKTALGSPSVIPVSQANALRKVDQGEAVDAWHRLTSF
jgi:hypothetical protein